MASPVRPGYSPIVGATYPPGQLAAMMAAMPGTASRVAVQAALDALSRKGIDCGPILRASGLTPALLASVDARFPFDNAQSLWDHAAAAAGDDHFGLHVAAELPDGYGVLDYLFCTSATLLTGYQRLTHFIRIGYDETDLKVIVEPLLVRLTRSVRARSRHYDEFLFGFLVFRGRRATGIDWTPRSAALRHSAPADRSTIERAFRCRVAFGAPRAELAFDRALGDTPLVQADSPLHAVMLEYAESLLARLAARPEVDEQVRAKILKALPAQLPTLESLARSLGLTPRALQRRLKDRGTSYVRILDGSRRDLALKYLSVASLSIGEISFLLHFSDVAAFNHAFKRWTATTPGQYRAELWTKPAPGMSPP